MYKKIISVVLNITLVFSFFNSFTFISAISVDSAVNGFAKFNIPESVGRVVETFQGHGDKKVICIEDLHCDAEVQRNISKIIHVAKREYGKNLDFVGIEGSAGEIDTSILGGVPSSKVRDVVTNRHVDNGDISGAELYTILYPERVLLYGLEDKSLYEQDFKSLYDSFGNSARLVHIYNKLNNEMNKLRAKAYPDTLKAFDEIMKKYEEGVYPFDKYIIYLAEVAEERGVDVQYMYPEVFKYYKALMIRDDKMDSQKSEISENDREGMDSQKSEISENDRGEGVLLSLEAQIGFIEKLLRKHIKEDEIRILEEMKSKNRGTYLLFMKKVLDKYNLMLPEELSELAGYFQYLSMIESIDNTCLLDQIMDLEYDIEKSFSKDNPDLDDLIFCSRFLKMFDEYLNNKIGKRGVDEVEAGRDEFFSRMQHLRGLKKEYFVDNMDFLNSSFNNMQSFYNLAGKRNEAILSNFFKKSGKGKVKVIIFGGYHSEGIKEFLRNKGISYDVVLPYASKRYDKSIYLKRLGEQAKEMGVGSGSHAQRESSPIFSVSALMVWTKFGNREFTRQIAIEVMQEFIKEKKPREAVLAKFLGDYQEGSRAAKEFFKEEGRVIWEGRIGNEYYILEQVGGEFGMQVIKRKYFLGVIPISRLPKKTLKPMQALSEDVKNELFNFDHEKSLYDSDNNSVIGEDDPLRQSFSSVAPNLANILFEERTDEINKGFIRPMLAETRKYLKDEVSYREYMLVSYQKIFTLLYELERSRNIEVKGRVFRAISDAQLESIKRALEKDLELVFENYPEFKKIFMFDILSNCALGLEKSDPRPLFYAALREAEYFVKLTGLYVPKISKISTDAGIKRDFYKDGKLIVDMRQKFRSLSFELYKVSADMLHFLAPDISIYLESQVEYTELLSQGDKYLDDGNYEQLAVLGEKAARVIFSYEFEVAGYTGEEEPTAVFPEIKLSNRQKKKMGKRIDEKIIQDVLSFDKDFSAIYPLLKQLYPKAGKLLLRSRVSIDDEQIETKIIHQLMFLVKAYLSGNMSSYVFMTNLREEFIDIYMNIEDEEHRGLFQQAFLKDNRRLLLKEFKDEKKAFDKFYKKLIKGKIPLPGDKELASKDNKLVFPDSQNLGLLWINTSPNLYRFLFETNHSEEFLVFLKDNIRVDNLTALQGFYSIYRKAYYDLILNDVFKKLLDAGLESRKEWGAFRIAFARDMGRIAYIGSERNWVEILSLTTLNSCLNFIKDKDIAGFEVALDQAYELINLNFVDISNKKRLDDMKRMVGQYKQDTSNEKLKEQLITGALELYNDIILKSLGRENKYLKDFATLMSLDRDNLGLIGQVQSHLENFVSYLSTMSLETAYTKLLDDFVNKTYVKYIDFLVGYMKKKSMDGFYEDIRYSDMEDREGILLYMQELRKKKQQGKKIPDYEVVLGKISPKMDEFLKKHKGLLAELMLDYELKNKLKKAAELFYDERDYYAFHRIGIFLIGYMKVRGIEKDKIKELREALVADTRRFTFADVNGVNILVLENLNRCINDYVDVHNKYDAGVKELNRVQYREYQQVLAEIIEATRALRKLKIVEEKKYKAIIVALEKQVYIKRSKFKEAEAEYWTWMRAIHQSVFSLYQNLLSTFFDEINIGEEYKDEMSVKKEVQFSKLQILMKKLVIKLDEDTSIDIYDTRFFLRLMGGIKDPSETLKDNVEYIPKVDDDRFVFTDGEKNPLRLELHKINPAMEEFLFNREHNSIFLNTAIKLQLFSRLKKALEDLYKEGNYNAINEEFESFLGEGYSSYSIRNKVVKDKEDPEVLEEEIKSFREALSKDRIRLIKMDPNGSSILVKEILHNCLEDIGNKDTVKYYDALFNLENMLDRVNDLIEVGFLSQSYKERTEGIQDELNVKKEEYIKKLGKEYQEELTDSEKTEKRLDLDSYEDVSDYVESDDSEFGDQDDDYQSIINLILELYNDLLEMDQIKQLGFKNLADQAEEALEDEKESKNYLEVILEELEDLIKEPDEFYLSLKNRLKEDHPEILSLAREIRASA